MLIFNALQKEDIAKIISIELQALELRIQELGFSLKLKKKAIQFLNDKGFDAEYGARPLARALQKYIEDALAEEIVKSKIPKGALLTFDWDGKSEELHLTIDHEKDPAKS